MQMLPTVAKKVDSVRYVKCAVCVVVAVAVLIMLVAAVAAERFPVAAVALYTLVDSLQLPY